MGLVTLGIPEQITIELARLNGSTVFVETGTFHGNTTRWASNHFEIVHTIERAEKLYNLHSHELAQIKGVTPHLGDSRNILPQIVRDIRGQRAVFWLDGHWSGGTETAGEDDECPLVDELACLSGRTEDIILIDDARYFLCAPPPPHKPSQWPTISDIVHVLPESGKKQFVQLVDDVIIIVPNEDALRNHLVEYAQGRAQSFWEAFGELQRSKVPLKTRLKDRLRRMGRRVTTSNARGSTG
jgi:hypothetical protein